MRKVRDQIKVINACDIECMKDKFNLMIWCTNSFKFLVV